MEGRFTERLVIKAGLIKLYLTDSELLQWAKTAGPK